MISSIPKVFENTPDVMSPNIGLSIEIILLNLDCTRSEILISGLHLLED